MKIGPTVDGRVKLHLEDKGDYYLLTQLVSDASDDGNIEALATQLGANVIEEDWEEFVKPELIANFQTDILTVSNIVKNAYDKDEKELFISKEDSQAWYSTINQARLHLEEKWKLSELEDDIDLKHISPALQEPYIKGNFYMSLQGIILEYIGW